MNKSRSAASKAKVTAVAGAKAESAGDKSDPSSARATRDAGELAELETRSMLDAPTPPRAQGASDGGAAEGRGSAVIGAPPAAFANVALGAASESAKPTRSDTSTPIERISETPGFVASAKVINIPRGLYAMTIGPVGAESRSFNVFAMPATHVAAVGESRSGAIRLIENNTALGGWVGPEGGTLLIEAAAGGGRVTVTTYRSVSRHVAPISIHISRLDRPIENPSAVSPPYVANLPQSEPKERGLELELNVHVERQAAARWSQGEWAGALGRKQRIEAFDIRPLEILQAGDIEYKAFGPNGRETSWKAGGQLCGAIGRGMPLTGFAIRLAPHLSAIYALRYDGAFFEGGVFEAEDGATCVSNRAGDNLEAMRVQIVKRT